MEASVEDTIFSFSSTVSLVRFSIIRMADGESFIYNYLSRIHYINNPRMYLISIFLQKIAFPMQSHFLLRSNILIPLCAMHYIVSVLAVIALVSSYNHCAQCCWVQSRSHVIIVDI